MNINSALRRLEKLTRKNSVSVYAGMGIGGVLITSYLAVKGTANAVREIDEYETRMGVADDNLQRIKERIQLVWPHYIPAGIAGVTTLACIAASARSANKKAAAVATAYTLSERAFAEYKTKVIEQIGERKEQGVRDAIAQESVTRNPPEASKVIITGSGEVMCCEMHTKRYFKSDMETLRRSMNDINSRVMHELYVSLDEFYYLIGLSPTSNSGDLGWDSERLMELQFSTALTEDGTPCITFAYNYLKPL